MLAVGFLCGTLGIEGGGGYSKLKSLWLILK